MPTPSFLYHNNFTTISQSENLSLVKVDTSTSTDTDFYVWANLEISLQL